MAVKYWWLEFPVSIFWLSILQTVEKLFLATQILAGNIQDQIDTETRLDKGRKLISKVQLVTETG